MSSNALADQLDDLHRRIIAGRRSASRDMFVLALGPLTAFLAKSHSALRNDEAHDLATDAILLYLKDPSRCDLGRASLWTYLCMVAGADALDQFRTEARRRQLLEKAAEDVADWARRANDVLDANTLIDARRIMELHGHKLASSESERRLLALILEGEKSTKVFAEALGLEPSAAETEDSVKQAKDRIKLRLKRLRDVL
jgi:DNA-directed RNA polymerase specialized sigma24 family protein